MATSTQYTCDGCDEQKVCDVGLPNWWKHVKISVEGLPPGSMPSGSEFDLCENCATRLAEYIDPGQWTRRPKSETRAA